MRCVEVLRLVSTRLVSPRPMAGPICMSASIAVVTRQVYEPLGVVRPGAADERWGKERSRSNQRHTVDWPMRQALNWRCKLLWAPHIIEAPEWQQLNFHSQFAVRWPQEARGKQDALTAFWQRVRKLANTHTHTQTTRCVWECVCVCGKHILGQLAHIHTLRVPCKTLIKATAGWALSQWRVKRRVEHLRTYYVF